MSGRGAERRRLAPVYGRIRNHVAIGAATALVSASIFVTLDSTDALFRASMATAYVALLLLAISLAFGPIAAIRGRRYPVSTNLRRDFGIWAGLVAVVHVVVGLQVHLRGKMWEYFAQSVKGTILPRIDPFGAANYTGAIAALILIALLVTSNDVSLRRLGVPRWQRLHALTPWALILTVLHGAAYQFVEKRPWRLVTLLGALSAAAIWLRFFRARQQNSGRVVEPPSQ